jgi:hypothetical protein
MFSCVPAQQVMHAVPAVAGLGQQPFLVQFVQQPGDFFQAAFGQGCSGVGVDRGARVQTQQAEEPLPGGS